MYTEIFLLKEKYKPARQYAFKHFSRTASTDTDLRTGQVHQRVRTEKTKLTNKIINFN